MSTVRRSASTGSSQSGAVAVADLDRILRRLASRSAAAGRPGSTSGSGRAPPRRRAASAGSRASSGPTASKASWYSSIERHPGSTRSPPGPVDDQGGEGVADERPFGLGRAGMGSVLAQPDHVGMGIAGLREVRLQGVGDRRRRGRRAAAEVEVRHPAQSGGDPLRVVGRPAFDEDRLAQPRRTASATSGPGTRPPSPPSRARLEVSIHSSREVIGAPVWAATASQSARQASAESTASRSGKLSFRSSTWMPNTRRQATRSP